MTTDSKNTDEAPRRDASACNEGLGPLVERLRDAATPTLTLYAEAAEAIEHLCADLADALAALPQAVRNERERCAKLCEEEACSWDEAYPRNDFEAGPQDGCDGCAARIRGA